MQIGPSGLSITLHYSTHIVDEDVDLPHVIHHLLHSAVAELMVVMRHAVCVQGGGKKCRATGMEGVRTCQ